MLTPLHSLPGSAIVAIPPGGGGYRVIDPVTGKEISIPVGAGSLIVDPKTGKVIGVLPPPGHGKEGLVDLDDPLKPYPSLLPPGCIVEIPEGWSDGRKGKPTHSGGGGGGSDSGSDKAQSMVVACECDPLGAMGISCSDAGQCLCKPGVVGKRCHQCTKGFYGFNVEGCKPCNCDRVGSLSSTCDESGRY